MNPITNGHANNISYPKPTSNCGPPARSTSPGRTPGTFVNPWEHGPQHQQQSDPAEWRATYSSPNNKMDRGSRMTNAYISSKQGQPRFTLKRWGGQHTEHPNEHRIVNVQRCGTILVAEHNPVETPQNVNKEAQIIRPRIQQYTYAAFEAFVQTNMHLVIADDQMQQYTFQQMLKDFPPERERFNEMIEWLQEGKNIDAASEGSRLVDGRTS